MTEIIEVSMYEEIDRVSEFIKNPAFEAYINLEGVFQGIERFIGDNVPKLFNVLSSKSIEKCLFTRLSLRRQSGTWDEAVILVSEGVVIGIYAVVDGSEVAGSEALDRIAQNMNKGLYSMAIMEVIELPRDFTERRLDVKIEKLVSIKEAEKAKKKTEEKPREERVEEKTRTRPKPVLQQPAKTIPIDASVEKTKVLPESEFRRFYQAVLRRAMGLPLPPPETKPSIEREEETSKPLPKPLDEMLKYEEPLLDLIDVLTPVIHSSKTNISTLKFTGDRKKLYIEVNASKLGLLMKKEKMMEIARMIGENVKKILNEKYSNLGLTDIEITVKHGWDVIKLTYKIK